MTDTTDIEYSEDRATIAELGRALVERNLTEGTGGNLSTRLDADHVAISPSGVPYHDITPEDVPVMTTDGEQVGGEYEPSVEFGMHRLVYEHRPDVGGVVHTHSPYATTFAVLDRPIPASHYLVAFAGDRVPVAEYASYGTAALAENAVEALGDDYDACLLRNHGVLAVGDSVGDAFDVAHMVEYCARLHYQASAIGEPVVLPDEEIASLRGRLESYGASQ